MLQAPVIENMICRILHLNVVFVFNPMHMVVNFRNKKYYPNILVSLRGIGDGLVTSV